ncbi:unnamed protein product [Lupinus luteus]|uniref:Uncharacterized protein n=1 Tax=Lupinus luteus TaxID=3873 RepID=A0AAV1VWI6_LUPLU
MGKYINEVDTIHHLNTIVTKQFPSGNFEYLILSSSLYLHRLISTTNLTKGDYFSERISITCPLLWHYVKFAGFEIHLDLVKDLQVFDTKLIKFCLDLDLSIGSLNVKRHSFHGYVVLTASHLFTVTESGESLVFFYSK